MEAIIIIVILLLLFAYTSFNLKVQFQINNKKIEFSIRDNEVSESSDLS